MTLRELIAVWNNPSEIGIEDESGFHLATVAVGSWVCDLLLSRTVLEIRTNTMSVNVPIIVRLKETE